MSNPDEITIWLDRLCEGDPEAAKVIWQEYFNRLMLFARRKLNAFPRRVADEEDIALSAINSFCHRAGQGQFPQLESGQDIWKLLVVISARKVYREVRRSKAAIRGGGQVRGESVFEKSGDDERLGIQQVLGREPTPEFAATLADNIQDLMLRLDDDILRQIATCLLEGQTQPEIAEQLDCSVRKVQRKVDLIRRIWARIDD